MPRKVLNPIKLRPKIHLKKNSRPIMWFFFFFPLIFSPKYRQSLYNKNVLLVSPSKFISFSSYTRNGTFTLTSN